MPALTRAGAISREKAPALAPVFNGYTLFWIFFSAAFAGALTETAFMLLTRGELQSRSSLLYGQLSLVWGLGAVLFTLLFHRLWEGSAGRLFLAGALAGTAFEYLCSWVQEVCFGANFWDYRHLPLNLNGRVNLMFSLFWGLAAVVWVRCLLPPLCRLVGRLPQSPWRAVTVVLGVLLCADILLTAAALGRMDARHHQVPAANPVQVFLDRHYSDRRLERSFSSLTYIGTPEDRRAAGMD